MIIGLSGRMGSGKDALASLSKQWSKRFAFADAVKEDCISKFGIDRESAYGTQTQKEKTLTNVSINSMIEMCPNTHNILKDSKSEYLSIRKLLQTWGTDVCRALNKNVWVDVVLHNIKESKHLFNIITDVRFKNEADAIIDSGGIVIRLTRNSNNNAVHSSELEMDDYENFTYVIDNENMDLEESYKKFYDLCRGLK